MDPEEELVGLMDKGWEGLVNHQHPGFRCPGWRFPHSRESILDGG